MGDEVFCEEPLPGKPLDGKSLDEGLNPEELPRGVVPIRLPSGAVVAARITSTDEYQDVGAGARAAAKLEQLGDLIADVGGTVLDAAAAVAPDEAGVSFGIELTAKSGKALAILAAGEDLALLRPVDERLADEHACVWLADWPGPQLGATHYVARFLPDETRATSGVYREGVDEIRVHDGALGQLLESQIRYDPGISGAAARTTSTTRAP
ncbi:CU044_2847 family protein [Streptomyces beihaiensis]|uniref:CU044_2847 family protein n=1 Tax=Streptomyces beihaiensis TaxID=2984495 RepID=A0ABT3TRN8_9ACTN|nr:CU044_2847 family protein [Streptomyces beihaiensis]MCX3058693.1 CU044_2847 family protein [Streptomyces beihaiensis]